MTHRVLIVEDDQALLNLFERAFQMVGYDVSTASDGDDALHHISQQAPDLLLLDLGIPGKDGLSILKYVRRHEKMMQHVHGQAQPPHTNIIVMTGNPLAADSPEAQLADMFLLKPVGVEHLLSIAKQLQVSSVRLVS